jgi:hypothetical protein
MFTQRRTAEGDNKFTKMIVKTKMESTYIWCRIQWPRSSKMDPDSVYSRKLSRTAMYPSQYNNSKSKTPV